MRWGIVFATTGWPTADEAIALAEAAEMSGFDSLWAPEHVTMPVEYDNVYAASADGRADRLSCRGGIPDPIVWFAYVASRTSVLKFGTGVAILPEHNTLEYAKSVATLASLSGGRFILGVGLGWSRNEYEALHVPWAHRAARSEEMVEALRLLWSEPQAAFDGRYVRFPKVACEPKPPGGSVPIVIGGSSRAAARRAGRVGDGYFPSIFPADAIRARLPVLIREMESNAREAGRDASAVEVTTGGARTAEEAKWFADQGVHRLTIACRSRTVADMRIELERFGRDVISKTGDL